MSGHGKFPRGYLPTLDGWRAIAILLVLLYHAKDSLARAGGPRIGWLLPFFESGGIGVNIFFGISGVLITARLLEEEEKRARVDLRGFYIRRACRILPALFFFLAVIGCLGLALVIPVRGSDWVRALLFATNYGPPVKTWFVAHTWSLSVEEHFYIFWPFALVLIGSYRAIVLGSVMAVVITVWRVLDIHYRIVPEYIGLNSWRTDTQLDSLLWGAVLACLLYQVSLRDKLLRLLSPATTWCLLFILAGALGALRYKPHLQHLVRAFQAVAIPLILAGTILNSDAFLGRVLEWSAFRWVGRLSYSLYLWQQLFFILASWNIPDGGWTRTLPFNFLAAFFCATMSYYLIERPCIKLGHKLARPATEGRTDLETIPKAAHG